MKTKLPCYNSVDDVEHCQYWWLENELAQGHGSADLTVAAETVAAAGGGRGVVVRGQAAPVAQCYTVDL